MKRSETLKGFRDLDVAGYDKEIADRKKELMELRFQAAVGQLANPARVQQLRREVAQLLTVRSERARSESGREAGK